MKKKMFLVSLAAMSLFAFTACSSGGSLNDDLVSMKGGSITVGDYYDQIKASQASTLQNMVILEVFNNAYGDKVTDKEVQEEFDKYAEGQDDFDAVLKQYGYTEKSYKEYIKQSLSVNKGLEANVKLTDEDREAAWESYHPEVEAQIIKVASEEEANTVVSDLDGGADFAKLAEEKSTDTETAKDGGKIKFDSTSTTVPAEVKTAAFELENGKHSKVITSTDASTYSTSYYVVKMVKNADKGDDMKKHEDKVKEIATSAKLADQTFTAEIIAKELKAANVKIKDDTFSDLLAGYLTTDSSTANSGTASSSSTDASSTADSSTTESTSESE